MGKSKIEGRHSFAKAAEDKQKALDRIAKEIENCQICKQDKIGKAVPGEGDPDANIVFLGEAPGKQEAATGRPFIGRAGKLLRSLIKEVGLKDEDVYITSPVKYLPKYVTPKPADIEHGRLHLFKQLEIIKPKVVVLLGNVASQAVLREKFPIAKIHGKIIKQDGITYLITYHPAAPLYNPNVKRDLVKDFEKLKNIINKS
jgi:uracil-DNA glycosylase